MSTAIDTMAGQLKPGRRSAYLFAGNATLTVRNPATGNRFTFKIQKADDAPMWYVRVLTGPDNRSDYRYLGILVPDQSHHTFRRTAKSAFGFDAPCAQALGWLVRNTESDRVEVWHEGRCGRCGRALTVPESIATGLGPVCAEGGN